MQIQLKRWNEAIGILEPLSRSAPNVAPIYFRLAQARSQTQDPAGAIEALRRGTSLLDPRKALAWLSRSDYDPLRSNPDFQKLIEELGAADK